MAKDAEDRWRTARDLTSELKWITRRGSVAGGPDPAAQPAYRVSWIVAALAIVAFLSALVPAVLYFRGPALEPVVTRLDIVTLPTSDAFSFALSPDGRQVSFVANGAGHCG